MAEYELVTKHVAWIGIARFINYGRGLILLPILTKVLGAGDYGVWSLILVTISLLLPFVMLGLPYGMGRFLPAERDRRKASKGIFTTLFTILFTSIIFASCLFFLADTVATVLLKDASFAPIIRIASLLVILQALSQLSVESFMPFRQVKTYSILTIIQTLMEIALVYFLVLFGFGLYGAIIALLVTRGIVLLISLPLIISRFGFSLPSFSVFRSYLTFGLPIVPSVIFEWVITSSDRYMIGFFLGAASVGIYSASYNMGAMAAVALYIITFATAPTVVKSYDEGKIEDTKNYLSYSLKYFLLFAIPSVFGLSILARPLLNSLTTPEFVSPGIFIVPLVASSMIFEGVRAIYGRVVQLSKHTGIFTIASVAAGLTNIGLNIIFIPRFGVIGAAIATLISYIMVGFIMYYNSRKYIRFEVDKGFVVKSILASIVMTSAIWAFSPVGIVKILLAIVIGIIIYFAVLFLLRGFKREELRVISKALGLRRQVNRFKRTENHDK
ncbi:hypothetical protein ES706_06311 [subsurface metagenome]